VDTTQKNKSFPKLLFTIAIIIAIGWLFYIHAIELLIVWIFLLVILSPMLAIFVFAGHPIGESIFYFFKTQKHFKLSADAQHDFFTNNFFYYKLLSDAEKRTFLRRVNYILLKKKIEGGAELVLKEEVKLLFAGCLVKLTFGLYNYELAWHGNIIFFPEVFEFRKSGVSFKGLTYSREKIVFSLPHFLEGIADPHDKLNLALHELAHALKANLTRDNSVYFETHEPIDWMYNASRFEWRFAEWHNLALTEFASMQSDTDSGFFRDYAATNMDEFWAVCVEHFFEAPVEFRHKLPRLYAATRKVLNQDMAARFDMANA
jgi:Mlc titration factor MtfA (ptsG expression regulator)